eukprot:311776-Amphidinium_carterae.1
MLSCGDDRLDCTMPPTKTCNRDLLSVHNYFARRAVHFFLMWLSVRSSAHWAQAGVSCKLELPTRKLTTVLFCYGAASPNLWHDTQTEHCRLPSS